jgi:hypothetical protein
MVDPITILAAISGGIGLWILVTGRDFRGYPKWPFKGKTLRVVGAYDLLGSLVVIALAQAGNKGFAFLTYAVLSLALVVVVTVVPKLKSGT